MLPWCENATLLFYRITVYFVDRDGDKVAAKATVGTTFLDVAIDNDVELEGTFYHAVAERRWTLNFLKKWFQM
jgi:hypothetical protein